jgi:tRNA (mo5U34)-methyltransferase
MMAIDYSTLYQQAHEVAMRPLLDALPALIEKNLATNKVGDLPRWLEVLDQLPDITTSSVILDADTIRVGKASDCNPQTREMLKRQLKNLHPWRKGPFNLFDIEIDTEWRSDWKWNRLKNALAPLAGKTVLDVGCGSGYHCWRMRGAGAARVIGIEPTPLFIVQFQALQKYIRDFNVHILPARLEELPEKLQAFDSVFSMGILYHRRSPFDHLQELMDVLKPGGQLILETLVIEGKQGEVLVPEGRYSKMGNIWFIPSVSTLETWLKKIKFENINHINTCMTSRDEQRSTEWMTFQSLADFLDPHDAGKTIEGYPAPKRAIFTATKPV